MALDLWRPRRGSMRRADWDEVFDRFFGDWPWAREGGQIRGWSPAVDMMDRPDEIVVRADLPGLEQKDLEVHVDQGVLTIRGERKEEQERKEDEYYCCERWAGSFARHLTLPAGVDTERIRATFKNGILEVHLPKSKAAAGKKIEIKAA